MKKIGKIWRRTISVVLTVTIICGLVAAVLPTQKAAAVIENCKYVDTSEYESLKEIYKDYFILGGACEAQSHWNVASCEIGNPDKEALIAHEFNSITCGNEMKPDSNIDFNADNYFGICGAAREMMQWAKDNGLGMRGHVLVWHSQTPSGWFCKNFEAYANGRLTKSQNAELDADCLVDRETMIERMRTYIYSMIEYTYKNGFASTIYAWDVVNEATDESTDDGLRRSNWYKTIGPEFLYYAFLFAREAETKYAKEYAADYGLDPDGDLSAITPRLFYNDYNEWIGARTDNIIRFLTKDEFNKDQSMIKSDVIAADGNGTIFGDGLIDGIGMQGHINDGQSIESYRKAMEAYNDAIGEIQITELDIGCTHDGDDMFYFQAQYFYKFFSMLIEEVNKGVNLSSVTLWGLTDATSWRKESTPLIFEQDLTAKPAFHAMVQAGRGEEFTVSLADSLLNFSDKFIDFEPYTDTNGELTTVMPKAVGVLSRDSGNIANIILAPRINHTVDTASIGYSAKVSRKDKDANAKIDVSVYAGKTVDAKLYVQIEDNTVRFGVDGACPVLLNEKTAADAVDGWIELSSKITLPEGTPSAFLYVETDGAGLIYLDDISIVISEPDGTEKVVKQAVLDGIEPNDVAAEISENAGNPAEDAEVKASDVAEKADEKADTGITEAGDKKTSDDEKAADDKAADRKEAVEADGNTENAETSDTAEEVKPDSSVSVVLWIILAVVAVAGLAILFVLKMRKKTEK